MEAPVEIRYAGVVIGRAQEVRGADGGSSFFLPVREPMPVGSVVRLRSGEREMLARVVHAVESPDPTLGGMEVRLIGREEEAAPQWIPPPADPVDKARPVDEPAKTAMPVIEVSVPITTEAEKEEGGQGGQEGRPAAEVRTESTLKIGAPSPTPTEPAPDALDDSLGPGPDSAVENVRAEGPGDGEAAGDAGPEPSPATEEPPPARPISGGSGRRKAKRRR
jgi:hypothetical protein